MYNVLITSLEKREILKMNPRADGIPFYKEGIKGCVCFPV